MKKFLIDKGVEIKINKLKNGDGFEDALFDALVFNKTREALGGNTRAMISGSAPISSEVLDFLKICFIFDNIVRLVRFQARKCTFL